MPSVSTGLPQIDALLGGSGLRPGRIVEFVGLPGSGKSALTLLAIKQILLSDADGKVLVLDTRASFPIYRLQLMLEEEPWMDQDQLSQCLNRVSIATTLGFLPLLCTMERLLIDGIDQNVKLIVIDNVSTPFKTYRQDDIGKRTEGIRYFAIKLRQLARFLDVPILTNNHLTTVLQPSSHGTNDLRPSLIPYLGESWALCVDFRILLDIGDPHKERFAQLIKSTMVAGEIVARPVKFQIQTSGIREIE